MLISFVVVVHTGYTGWTGETDVEIWLVGLQWWEEVSISRFSWFS